MIRGVPLSLVTAVKRLIADPRVRRVLVYLAERAVREIIDRVAKKIGEKKKD